MRLLSTYVLDLPRQTPTRRLGCYYFRNFLWANVFVEGFMVIGFVTVSELERNGCTAAKDFKQRSSRQAGMGMRKGDRTWISCGLKFTSDPTVSETHLLRLVHAVLDNHGYNLSSRLQQKLAGSLAAFNVLHFVSTASLMILRSSVAAVSTYLVRSSNVLEVVHLVHSDIHLVLDNEVEELIGILLKFLSRRDTEVKGCLADTIEDCCNTLLVGDLVNLCLDVLVAVVDEDFSTSFLGQFELLLCTRCSDGLRTNSSEQLTQPQANTSSGSMNQNPIPLLHMISLSDQSQSRILMALAAGAAVYSASNDGALCLSSKHIGVTGSRIQTGAEHWGLRIRIDVVDTDIVVLDQNLAVLWLGHCQVCLVLQNLSPTSFLDDDTLHCLWK
ncbi:hypothetical protein KCU83_g316, partial [Aureobasidium melanogenum]